MEISCKTLLKLVDIDHRCNDCKYFNGVSEILGTRYMCKLTRTLMANNYACGLHNLDITKQPICYNCKHFLGGGDWGLSCSADYYTLTHATDTVCENFKWREDDE